MATLTITMPLPYPRLTPNLRLGWRERARLTREQREMAHWWARQSAVLAEHRRTGAGPFFPTGRVRLDVTMCLAPGFRQLDDDNAWASLKAIRDGLADALELDDKYFTQGRLAYALEQTGTVTITLTEEGERS